MTCCSYSSLENLRERERNEAQLVRTELNGTHVRGLLEFLWFNFGCGGHTKQTIECIIVVDVVLWYGNETSWIHLNGR